MVYNRLCFLQGGGLNAKSKSLQAMFEWTNLQEISINNIDYLIGLKSSFSIFFKCLNNVCHSGIWKTPV